MKVRRSAIEWRFLTHEDMPGAFHMAVDEALLDLVGRGDSPPTLRAYTWRPAAVSLGRSQRNALQLDPESCLRAGVDVVLRPSGGRAVLHKGDVTYSAVFPVRGLLDGGGVPATYRRLAGVLMSALRILGVEPDMAPTRRLGGRRAALPCFTAAARDEILIGGKKVVGSAQRRTRSAVLQHGAILVRGSQAELASLIADEGEAEALRRDLSARTACLEESMNRPVAFEEVTAALKAGAESALDAEIVDGELTEDELLIVEELSVKSRGGES